METIAINPKFYNASLRESIYKYREKNYEYILELQRKNAKKWYEANKEKRRETMLNYYYRKKKEKQEQESKGDEDSE